MPSKLRELLDEFRSVLGNRLLDVILPPTIFLLVNGLWGLTAAIAAALALSLMLGFLRWRRGEPLRYALGGVASVLLAIGLVWILGRAEGYFLPGLFSGVLTVALCLVSLFASRPLTAWSSYLARHWPLNWYWHGRVRPAYTETTLLWTLFFGVRLAWQIQLYLNSETNTLAWVQSLTGWPAIILLLVVTYLYGTWRLKNLRGPSLDEFKSGVPAPWQGQHRGF
ncbi:MAG: DUF3159 domain-containing protein [Chloroflexota bacterium]